MLPEKMAEAVLGERVATKEIGGGLRALTALKSAGEVNRYGAGINKGR